MREERYRAILEARSHRPEAIVEAAARRVRPTSLFNDHGRLMIIAGDHPARGSLRACRQALAMADRIQLLDRLCVALSRPGVKGVLGTPDIVEDLLLLGALDGKVVIGSMNRGGLAGAVFEIDDRFTGYDAAALALAASRAARCCCASIPRTRPQWPPSRPVPARSASWPSGD